MAKKTILKVAYSSIFTAITLITTAVLKFSTGLGEGYVHLGDCMIYLSACLLPFPYCLIPGAIGGALADILGGFAVWSIPTAIIKAFNALPFLLLCRKNDTHKILTKKTTLSVFISSLVTMLGYFFAEAILYSVASAQLSIIENAIQVIANAIVFFIISAMLDKTNFKSIFKELK